MIFTQRNWAHQRQVNTYSLIAEGAIQTSASKTKIHQPHIIHRVDTRRDSTRAGILGVLAYVGIVIGTMMGNKESQLSLEETVQPSIMQMYGSVEYNEFLEGERREQERLLAIEEAEQLSTFRSILPTDGYAHVSQ